MAGVTEPSRSVMLGAVWRGSVSKGACRSVSDRGWSVGGLAAVYLAPVGLAWDG